MFAPAGPASVKVRTCPASGSVPVAVKASNEPSATLLLPIEPRTGAKFAPSTMIRIVSESLNCGEPESVTRIVTTFVLGDCALLGSHENEPDDALMDAPAGAPGSKLNVRVWRGRSESTADAVKRRVEPRVAALLPMVARIGAAFTSLTMIVMPRVAVLTGEPLSATRTVRVLVPGPF